MKILISSDGMHAHYYQRASWLKAFTQCGIQTYLWDCKKIAAFDVFDTFEPDIFNEFLRLKWRRFMLSHNHKLLYWILAPLFFPTSKLFVKD